MPNVKSIKKTMLEKDIPAEILTQIDWPKPKGNGPAEVQALIEQMDILLTHKQNLSIMSEQGCGKTGKFYENSLLFGSIYADKTIEERIELLTDTKVHPNVPCRINDDGTLSVYWEIGEDNNYWCVCASYKRLKKDQPQLGNVSKTYCACCGGHIRHHYQIMLGVGLKLIEVVSSPISSYGEKRCEFLFEIVAPKPKVEFKL